MGHKLVVCMTVAALTLASGACDNSPTSPTSRSGVVLVRLEIIGPDAVVGGEPVQFGARGFLSDGTTRDVTGQVRWSLGNIRRAVISDAGLVTGGTQRGETQVIATYVEPLAAEPGAARALHQLHVMPPGTYRFAGVVKNDGVFLDGARVDLQSPAFVSTAVTTAGGAFVFYGVSGDAEIRVITDGYLPDTLKTTVTSHRTEEFNVRLLAMIEGSYKLRISAAGECRAGLPEAVRERTYPVEITQHGSELDVHLRDRAVQFGGTVEPGRVTFVVPSNLNSYPRYIPPVLFESLDSVTSLATFGSVVAAPRTGGAAGTLDGSIEVWEQLYWWDDPWDISRLASCRSTAHEFTLSR